MLGGGYGPPSLSLCAVLREKALLAAEVRTYNRSSRMYSTDDENPFCEDGKDPKQKSGAGGAGAIAAAVYLFSLYSFVSRLSSTT